MTFIDLVTNMEIKTTTNAISQQLGNYQHLYNLSRTITKEPQIRTQKKFEKLDERCKHSLSA